MARLRYNGLTATLGADLLTADTTITFSSALTHVGGTAVPTIGVGDYIPLAILDATTNGLLEIVHLTAYTSGATTGTVTRAEESTTAADQPSGSTVVNGVTVADIDEALAGGGGGGGGGGSANAFLYKTYTLSPAPSGSYTDSASTVQESTDTTPTFTSVPNFGELTNGKLGSMVYTDTEYVGWLQEATMVATIDAETAVSGSNVTTIGLAGTGGIQRPSGYKVEHSDDASSWTTVGTRTGLSQGTGLEGAHHWRLKMDVSAAGEHRYWRVTVYNAAAADHVFLTEIQMDA